MLDMGDVLAVLERWIHHDAIIGSGSHTLPHTLKSDTLVCPMTSLAGG
jgi:hypothetical protein